MQIHNHYFYDSEKCEFVPIEYNLYQQIAYNLSIWILTGITLAGIGLMVLSIYIGTPSELALKSENKALIQQLEVTQEKLLDLDQTLATISERDNAIYRSIMGLETLDEEESLLGVGGSNQYQNFEVYSENAASILEWTSSKLDEIERRINVQDVSLEEVKEKYNSHKEALSHIPAI